MPKLKFLASAWQPLEGEKVESNLYKSSLAEARNLSFGIAVHIRENQHILTYMGYYEEAQFRLRHSSSYKGKSTCSLLMYVSMSYYISV